MQPRPTRGRDPERRQQLLDAADTVVRLKGPAASMEDIAAEAGVTKPVVYRHFGDKSGLYRALAEQYVEALLDRLREPLASAASRRERLAATLDTYLSFVSQERQAYRFLLYGEPSATLGHRAVQSAFIRRFGEEIAAQFASAADEETTQVAQAWGHGIVGMVHLAGDWWLDDEGLSRSELVDALTTLLWNGVSAAPEVFGRRR